MEMPAVTVKDRTVRENKTTSKTMPNIKANKKYYVRVQIYKEVKIRKKYNNLFIMVEG